MPHNAAPAEHQELSSDQVKNTLEHAHALMTEDRDKAIELLEDLLLSNPDQIEAMLELTLVYFKQERYGRAYEHMKRAVNLQPDSGKLWYLLGKCLYKLFHCDAALIAYDKAIALKYITVRLYTEKSLCLVALNRFEEALEIVNLALSKQPNAPLAWQTKGTVSEMMGDLDTAERCYNRVSEVAPGDPAILYRLSDIGRLSQENFEYCDPDHEIHANRTLTWYEKTPLYFARAIEEARRGEYDAAFASYVKANAEVRSEYDYDRNNAIVRTDLHIKHFTPELFEQYKGAGYKGQSPVFIVGMPRSGTTLIEQILASHPKVAAGGEVTYVSRVENSLIEASRDGNLGYPASVNMLTPLALEEFADQYMRHIRQCVSESGEIMTDKMPPNFLNLGLISLVFPNAKIIHAKRNPIDTCLSCFFKRFNDFKHLAFSFNLEDIGFYYNEYLRLMAHWEKVLPIKMLEIQYEDMIEDQENVSRKMLEYVGLEWDDRCLKFYEHARGVTTASLHQVRKPIYKSAAGRWKRYEKHIAPLLDILKMEASDSESSEP